MFGNAVVSGIPSRRIRRIYYRLMGADLSSESVVFRGTDILGPKKLKISQGSTVGWHCLLDARGGIEIGKNVTVAGYSKLVTGSHDIEDSMFLSKFLPIKIEDYVWICTGATILQGVTIGRGAVVCAGAVVTKDVPPMNVVGGVPAKTIKIRETEPIFQENLKWSRFH